MRFPRPKIPVQAEAAICFTEASETVQQVRAQADPGIAGSAGTGPVDLSMEEVIDMLEELPEEDLERLLVWMKEYLEENNTP